MTKTVFDNAMVAHVWAQQNQETGRSNNGNFHFTGDTIYSYRTPIACFAETVTGKKVALVTSNRYSVTTSCKHMPAVTRALDHKYFCVPVIMGERHAHGAEDHRKNLAHLVNIYINMVAKLKRQRDPVSEYQNEALTLAAVAAADYASAFGLPLPALNSDADLFAISVHRTERDARNNTPQAKAARERAAARKAEKLRELIGDPIAAWRKGVMAYPFGLTRDQKRQVEAILREHVLMRVSGEEIVTSLSARFPVEHGKKAFAFILERRMRGLAWERNGHSIHLGNFSIDRIDANGDVRAGCHFVKWEEIERMARELGLLPPSPVEITAAWHDESASL